ncbi:uncharacterized protein B0P05DRAFT_180494 [Gilbertella persicaria]|uniref:uncharacterized protein n=1 Tax=Gilbertella persicaria TaxID=101096 RepID=UPI0022210EC7|nr:uncharacterized protein B0P05DRAFT_180494 [Gilbertella persicaria]KAI8071136.1 hypothetical protein B0P05DRAFT_180494 [Gilbertella persicaria]
MNPKMIILACRESDKAKRSNELVCSYTNALLEYMDLADLSTVKACVDRLVNQNITIDVLINNAGVLTNHKSLTKDGFEIQFGTNYLGHFYFTELLIAKQIINKDAKIIQLSSHAMLFGRIAFEDIMFEKRSYSGWKAYTQSKLANVVYANYLHRQGFNTYSVHPGMVRTNFAKKHSFYLLDIIFYPIFYLLSNSPAQGAQTSIFLASTDQPSGLYWMNCKPFNLFKSKQSQDESVQNQLYVYSQNAVYSATGGSSTMPSSSSSSSSSLSLNRCDAIGSASLDSSSSSSDNPISPSSSEEI